MWYFPFSSDTFPGFIFRGGMSPFSSSLLLKGGGPSSLSALLPLILFVWNCQCAKPRMRGKHLRKCFFVVMVTKPWHRLSTEFAQSLSVREKASGHDPGQLAALLEQEGWTRWPPEVAVQPQVVCDSVVCHQKNPLHWCVESSDKWTWDTCEREEAGLYSPELVREEWGIMESRNRVKANCHFDSAVCGTMTRLWQAFPWPHKAVFFI